MNTADGARGHARSGFRFIVVGASAAATHYFVGLVAYTFFGVAPGVANVLGYCAGFPVSYGGQRYWTFSHSREPHRVALPRYVLTQLIAFAASQTLLLLALRFLPLPFWFVFGAVLVIVAAGTYGLSKLWVFRA